MIWSDVKFVRTARVYLLPCAVNQTRENRRIFCQEHFRLNEGAQTFVLKRNVAVRALVSSYRRSRRKKSKPRKGAGHG